MSAIAPPPRRTSFRLRTRNKHGRTPAPVPSRAVVPPRPPEPSRIAEKPDGKVAAILLDVRGESFAAQTGRTIALLETAADGQEVVHLNTEVPVHLLPYLTTRGYRYRIHHEDAGCVQLHIRRQSRPSGRWPWTPRVQQITSRGAATRTTSFR